MLWAIEDATKEALAAGSLAMQLSTLNAATPGDLQTSLAFLQQVLHRHLSREITRVYDDAPTASAPSLSQVIQQLKVHPELCLASFDIGVYFGVACMSEVDAIRSLENRVQSVRNRPVFGSLRAVEHQSAEPAQTPDSAKPPGVDWPASVELVNETMRIVMQFHGLLNNNVTDDSWRTRPPFGHELAQLISTGLPPAAPR